MPAKRPANGQNFELAFAFITRFNPSSSSRNLHRQSHARTHHFTIKHKSPQKSVSWLKLASDPPPISLSKDPKLHSIQRSITTTRSWNWLDYLLDRRHSGSVRNKTGQISFINNSISRAMKFLMIQIMSCHQSNPMLYSIFKKMGREMD